MISKRALFFWGVLSLLVIASLLVIWLWRGSDGFQSFIHDDPFTDLPITLAAVTIVWLLSGLIDLSLSLWNASTKPGKSMFFDRINLWASTNLEFPPISYEDN